MNGIASSGMWLENVIIIKDHGRHHFKKALKTTVVVRFLLVIQMVSLVAGAAVGVQKLLQEGHAAPVEGSARVAVPVLDGGATSSHSRRSPGHLINGVMTEDEAKAEADQAGGRESEPERRQQSEEQGRAGGVARWTPHLEWDVIEVRAASLYCNSHQPLACREDVIRHVNIEVGLELHKLVQTCTR